ncbi:MAG TPA: FIST N-terminal domain-containing protein [Candidatus Sulfomarinibacteraceae bacterium]|nr:FIST N-terminal domain-containing protein [Candidatus Sulfomarinibacteraceae bacterium]
MRVEQRVWSRDDGWRVLGVPVLGARAQLVLAFGGAEVLRAGGRLEELDAAYPGAVIVGCSTAGEICGTHVGDDTVVATAVAFEHTAVRAAHLQLGEVGDSREAGWVLAEKLAAPDLSHVLVFSDGLAVNGSELTRGLVGGLPGGVQVTGGLAGDGRDFRETLIVTGVDALPRRVVAVGLYGERLFVGCGSVGGWDPFGPERLVTRSRGNVLYELDGRSALELYKRYLGEYAADLPASALLFPLSLRSSAGSAPLVRTVLSIDEADGSMTFAGDLPEGQYARLMKANFERIIDGASDAARDSYDALGSRPPGLALLISCVGRRMVLQQRVEEELEAVREMLGPDAVLTGFYSYGEIAPFSPAACSELHNQTMTITTLLEI